DVRKFVAPVHMHAENVQAGARQFHRGGLAESAAGAQNQGPRLFDRVTVHLPAHVTCLTSISLSSFPVVRMKISVRCGGNSWGKRSPHSISTSAPRSKISSRPSVATWRASSRR